MEREVDYICPTGRHKSEQSTLLSENEIFTAKKTIASNAVVSNC